MALTVVAGSGIAFASTQFFGTDQVGQSTDRGLVVSDDQYLNPIGDRVVLNNGEIMAAAVSRTVATSRRSPQTAPQR